MSVSATGARRPTSNYCCVACSRSRSCAGAGPRRPRATSCQASAPGPSATPFCEAAMSDFPMHEWPQHKYPRLRGHAVGEDGEHTTQLTRGLPCCGLDLLIEHPARLTAVELYQIAGWFCELTEKVAT